MQPPSHWRSLSWIPQKSVRLFALAKSRVGLAGIAAEAERLQVADRVRAALVPGDDGVHLQCPLVLGLPCNSLRPSARSGPGLL